MDRKSKKDRQKPDSDQAEAAQKDKAGRRPKDLHIYPSWCKQCGICAAFCPTGALDMGPDGHPVWKNPDACIGCKMCELRCPDFAIEVVLKEEEKAHAGAK